MLYLLGERLLLDRYLRSIPLRICITGTRGKSSVARLVAACLREAGYAVLAKTTGSRPVLIFPGGEEKEIRRRGSPSILEEKKILRLASRLKVQALVSELMSIHPECGFVESVQIFKPQIIVLTNVRLDHLDQMGATREKIARSLASFIPGHSTIFVPEDEFFPVFEQRAERLNSRLVKVPKESLAGDFLKEKPSAFEFKENIRLALAVTEFLRIEREAALRGMSKASPDFGSLKVWATDLGEPSRRFYLISGFAANDPESTRRAFSNLSGKIAFQNKDLIGFLNLRRDRGDRSVQWLKALKAGAFPEFQKIFLFGDHGHVLKRKLKKSTKAELSVVREKEPKRIMERISAVARGEAVLFGMGNMGGIGKKMVQYWESIGEPHGF